jgi:hypothetical protein
MLFASITAAAPAHAGLIASESFDGNTGTLAGQSGGSGWNGAWVTGQTAVFQVQAAGLTGGFGSSGGSLLFDGSAAAPGTGARVFRQLDLGPSSPADMAGLVESTMTRYNGTQPALGKPGTTVWLGVVFHGGTAGNGIAGVQYLDQVHLYNGATTSPSALSQGDNNKDGEALAIGRGNGNTAWNYERTCAHDACPNGSMSSSGYVSTVTMDSLTHWVVMRFVFVSSATTQITMWLDPAPGSSDPSDVSALSLGGQQLVSVTALHFSWIELGGQTSRFSFDEIRLATTFIELSYNQALAVPPATAPSLRIATGPNPVASSTTVWFDLPTPQATDLRVVDVAGRTIRALAAGVFGAGRHAATWDGRDARGAVVPGGVYFVRLSSRDGSRLTSVLRLP